MLKKIIPVLALIVMVFGLSMGVSAEDDYMVEIYLQTADRTVSPVDVDLINQSPITVLVDEGDTLQDAIEEAIPSADWYGDYIEELTYNSITYANQIFAYTDISVPPENPWTHGIWEGTIWYWFEGEPDDMPVTIEDYPNYYRYTIDYIWGETFYWSYPEITDDTTFTLSFESSYFIW
jgi:hypothetical protein